MSSWTFTCRSMPTARYARTTRSVQTPVDAGTSPPGYAVGRYEPSYVHAEAVWATAAATRRSGRDGSWPLAAITRARLRPTKKAQALLVTARPSGDGGLAEVGEQRSHAAHDRCAA